MIVNYDRNKHILLATDISISLCDTPFKDVAIRILSTQLKVNPGNTNVRGRLSTVNLLIKVARFVTNVNNIFNIQSS
jgi:hypothetical protein